MPVFGWCGVWWMVRLSKFRRTLQHCRVKR
jgi:hypothetical protein